jgi:hypothetical protein
VDRDTILWLEANGFPDAAREAALAMAKQDQQPSTTTAADGSTAETSAAGDDEPWSWERLSKATQEELIELRAQRPDVWARSLREARSGRANVQASAYEQDPA